VAGLGAEPPVETVAEDEEAIDAPAEAPATSSPPLEPPATPTGDPPAR